MKTHQLALLLLVASVASAFAGDISGRWKAPMPSPDGSTGPDLFFTFAVKGDQLTGTVDSPMGSNEIKHGTVNGTACSFAIEFDGNAINYKGRIVSDDEISLDVSGFGDGMKLQLNRTKEEPAKAKTSSQPVAPRTHVWWQERFPGLRPYTVANKKLPLISVKGNKFVDPSGNTVLFRGLAISDPDKLEMQGHWTKEHFIKVKEMGTKLVRIPIHPVAWRERTPAEYLKLLDQAVGWCTELDMYVMLDWHSIGNLETEVFQDPMYDTTQRETYNFWRTMARHFAGHNTVAFFELFNEPTTYRDQLGPVTWSDWKKIVETEITMIRASNPQVIPVVAGFDWAYDLTPVRLDPIAAERIAYSVHPYANKRPQPWEPKWELDFGFVADKYPVIATEFGGFPKPPVPNPGTPATDLKDQSVRNATYGPEIIKYLEGRGISWTVWCFDPTWGPTLIKNWNYELNASGEFAKAAMNGEIK
jgi:aryl-phospho-beta-D-glucosidase BglC (GH1 family)